MGYQNAPATITVTRDGQPVDMRPDYERKVVSVFIGGEYVGTYRHRQAAKEAHDLVDVPAPKKGRKAA
jgi:hypothetical protein